MKPLGFPRSARLLLGRDFQSCFAARQRVSGRYFVLNWIADASGPRLGLAVSRKVDRRAVQRNRLKRLVRECFRTHAAGLPPANLVVTPRREAVLATASALRDELHALFDKLSTLPCPRGQGTMPPACNAPLASRGVTSAR